MSRIKERYLSLRLECAGKTLDIGRGKDCGLLAAEGFESADYRLGMLSGAQTDGVSVTGRKTGPRVIYIEAEFPDAAEVAVNRERIVRFFSPKESGVLTVDWSGTRRKISYEVESLQILQENIYEPVRFAATLLCPAPYFTDAREFSGNMAAVVPLISFPAAISAGGSAASYRQYSRDAAFVNRGDLAVGLDIRMIARGEVVNPRLENLTTGEFLRVETQMEPGDELYIGTKFGGKRIEQNGENISNRIDRGSTFFQMVPGENILRYDAEQGYLSLDVYPRWSAAFWGI